MGAQKIVVLGTGGTIAGGSARADDNVGYRAGEHPVQALLQGLGELPLPEGVVVQAEQVAQIDSKDAGFAFWA
ncbi:MAG: asparaginase domain-containing protein, partial [Giesbergeria sp.]